jgi:hypothetical protein
MKDDITLKNDFAKLSKPIEIKPSKKGFLDKIGDFFKSKPQINIFSTSPKPIAKQQQIRTDAEIRQEQISNNHSQTTDSSKAADFFQKAEKTEFADADNQKQISWIESEKDMEGKIGEEKPISFMWIIGGAITIVIIIVMILGSFGLVNLIKTQIEERSLSNSEQATKQASEMMAAGDYESAQSKINEVLIVEPDNVEAKKVLKEIYTTLGKQLIDESLKFKNLTQPAELNPDNIQYIDPKNHFQFEYPTSWQIIDSNYDLKLANGNAFYGIKKYPKTNSLSELEQKFQEQYIGQEYEIMAKKENTTIADSNTVVYVAKVDNMYQVSFLMQKYYFGYEISTWMSEKDYNSGLNDWQKILASFKLNEQFDIASYNDLEIFGDDKMTIYSWPNKISDEEKNDIETKLHQSIDEINKKLLINFTVPIEIYLYPDWATFYKYTLADNSFSDYQNPKMHIVYENANSHQSFGYETTKIIFQKTFSGVKESLIIEGVAVLLDQTGRDYLAIVKENTFIPLSELLGVQWDLAQGDLKYFEAGLFSKYLIEKYGIDLYANLANEKEFPTGYQNIYGKSLSELESEFKVATGL